MQGFLLMSLLTRLSSGLKFPAFGPVAMLVNYGFDRVRFVRTVPVGAGVRLHGTLSGSDPATTAPRCSRSTSSSPSR